MPDTMLVGRSVAPDRRRRVRGLEAGERSSRSNRRAPHARTPSRRPAGDAPTGGIAAAYSLAHSASAIGSPDRTAHVPQK